MIIVQRKEDIVNNNEVIILVRYGCKELGAITIKNIKANTSNFYSLKHLYTDLLVQHRFKSIFKELGSYELKCELEINEYDVEIWNFKIIDFKPS